MPRSSAASVLKSRMREICTSSSVGGRGATYPVCPTLCVRGLATIGWSALGSPRPSGPAPAGLLRQLDRPPLRPAPARFDRLAGAYAPASKSPSTQGLIWRGCAARRYGSIVALQEAPQTSAL